MDNNKQQLQERLRELKKFQEKQENLLKAKQLDTRALLTREQIQMYEMLGLSVSNFAEVSSEPINIESENETEFEDIRGYQDKDDANESSDNESVHHQPVPEYNNELVKKDTSISPLKNVDEFEDEANENQVKRPFLKRGAGLTSRFRIPPDAYNLKKLPRYKYADRVRKSLGRMPSSQTKTQANDPRPTRRKSEPIKKRAESPASTPSSPVSVELVAPTNVFLKLSSEPLVSPVQEPQIQEWFDSRNREKQPTMSDAPANVMLPKGVSWAQILSSNNIANSPVNVDHLLNPAICQNETEMDETSLFHLLEDKVNNMSLDISMSSIMKLLVLLKKPQGTSGSQDNDNTKVNPDDPIIDNRNNLKLQLQPLPDEIKKIILDETSEDDDEFERETEDDDDEQNHVRFCDRIEVVGDDTEMSTDIERIELSPTSTPNERQKFHDFKKRFLGHRNGPEERNELKQKSEMLKTKLEALEAEIGSVRQQNSQIAKMRQEMELEKMRLENDREDMMEQLKDDRIKMELQLHDDRIKIEQEKQKLDKMLKNPSKKEREETVKLKETIEELKEDLKIKEARHGSSSARYRSQLKTLEKENQSMKLELDVIKKENKKLEMENSRLRKDTNSKMLQEINRNIAKLAPSEIKIQPEIVKKVVVRKSEPAIKKRVKSVPDLNEKSFSSSSDEESSSTKISKKSKENNPTKVRRSDPVRISQMSTPSSDVLTDMKREIVNSDGSKDIWYPNGNLKKISTDGMLIRMLYFNKDIKETNINEGTVKYYYSETNTWHTTYIDGLEILEYEDGQIEHRYKDGTNEVHFPNGSIRITNPNWTNDTKEEWRLPDGTNIKIQESSKILTFPNGQREIHTPNHKRREYPDGTVKMAYEDGSYETRYSNGRIRIKDGKGNLISDTMAN